ncbi:ParB/RepB/Spo0J family partition protein [Pontibaca methylaminivorans]|uniref:Chromosome partitioning protein, ParB family n=1 Tax=Pontibaca methylaminivorans TaxID=515897 RepID=A0A1R3WS59_9RHOB|nr:ParB/RepB/Spo0J family partition protein [Pontibaca methylaminivorans]SIT80854.1 chromosome partitioning protein, ParB family [Pontibaca methylaminivorans]
MTENKARPRGLGRGLSALMADVTINAGPEQAPARPDMMVPIEQLRPNPNQPRRRFAQEDLDDLAASIREKGVIQPLIVRKTLDDQYEIVAGERRWRAAQQAQLHELPVLVRELDDVEVLEVAIIENIQRADLNAIEEAAGYRQLMDSFGHTQEKMAEALGKSRSHIANLLRLLNLPPDVQEMLQEGRLTAGHARALIATRAPSDLARKVVSGGLSVRATEALVRRVEKDGEARPGVERRATEKDADTVALEADLSAGLGMKVALNHRVGQETGELVVRYSNLEELDTLCRLLSGK